MTPARASLKLMTTSDCPHPPRDVLGPHGIVQEWSRTQLLQASDGQPEWLLPGLLLRAQPGMFVSPPAVGKTTVMTQIAVALATGTPVLGIEVVHPIPVVFVELEDPPHVMSSRIEAILAKEGLDGSPDLDANFRLWTPGLGCDRRFTMLFPAIVERFKEFGRPGGLLVVDTFHATFDGDENAADPSRMLWACALDLGISLGVTTAFIHHLKKADEKSAPRSGAFNLDWIRGSSSNAGSARFIMHMATTARNAGSAGQKRARLGLPMVNGGAPCPYMDLEQDQATGLWTRVEADQVDSAPLPQRFKPTPRPSGEFLPLRDRLFQLISKHPAGSSPLTRVDMALTMLGTADSQAQGKIRAALRDLRDKGRVDEQDQVAKVEG